MAANSVEKHCYVVLNVKLEVKVRFETFYWLLELSPNAFALITVPNTRFTLLERLAYPSNKYVICRPSNWNWISKAVYYDILRKDTNNFEQLTVKQPSRGVLKKRCSENTAAANLQENTHTAAWFQ